MASVAEKEELPPTTKLELKLLVDQNSHRVVFAQAGKDVADFLLGLLGLPLSYVRRLVGKQQLSNSIPTLCSNIESLPDEYLIAPAVDRAALLNPNTSSYSLTLLENKPKTSEAKKVMIYYDCSGSWYHPYLSEVSGTPCPSCRSPMASVRNVWQGNDEAGKATGGGYVKRSPSYIVMDDLAVVPISTVSAIELLHKFQVKDVSSLYESVVEVGMEEGLELLKASLLSKTVLTEVFLPKFEGEVSIRRVELSADVSTTNV
ncbi:uncharacterized protein [Typha angustifolia]|uniref:uncharacterized protein n=1 Tax=Typha angustifolia TaxID=59011 RepID=UPI003C2F27E3